MLRGVRGAITVENNTVDEIKNAVLELVNSILEKNDIDPKDIACVDFTMTKDLNCVYPAKFAREIEGFSTVPLMCYQELEIQDSLKNCIRVRFLINTDKTQTQIRHIYLKDAKKLRPDLSE